jgi:hypothetical protein
VPLIPVAILLEVVHADAVLIFAASALGVIPTAALMGRATEELAARSGPGIGGFLNVTFGNAPELIIALVRARCRVARGREGIRCRVAAGQHPARHGRVDARRRPDDATGSTSKHEPHQRSR